MKRAWNKVKVFDYLSLREILECLESSWQLFVWTHIETKGRFKRFGGNDLYASVFPHILLVEVLDVSNRITEFHFVGSESLHFFHTAEVFSTNCLLFSQRVLDGKANHFLLFITNSNFFRIICSSSLPLPGIGGCLRRSGVRNAFLRCFFLFLVIFLLLPFIL
jgi:hypothetical protein